SNAPSSSSPRIRPSTTTSATPTGKSGALWRLRSSGRTRAISNPTRKTSTRSSRSCAPAWSTRRCRPRPPRPQRSRATAVDTAAVPTKLLAALPEFAPAKVNLTLRVLGRRSDGYHEIESLVVFADIGDLLMFFPGPKIELSVKGRTAESAGATEDNLVLRAARTLAERIDGLKLGRFEL